MLHIGVGLERHYNIGYERHPQVMLVCDTGNSTVRMIQAQIARKYPQLVMTRIVSLRDYEMLAHIDEDFVISNARIGEKNKPVVVMSPFPTDYQLEQLGKLVLVDRTRPYMLEKFFDAGHFMVLNEPLTQAELFSRVCGQLEREGYVGADFIRRWSNARRSSPPCWARASRCRTRWGCWPKTVVVTLLAPQGVAWGEGEVAHVIFLLAISKSDYEEAMAIYELFVTFVRERSMSRLLSSDSFDSFKAVALDCLSRS